MCRSFNFSPVCLKVTVIFIVAFEMVHDCIILGVAAWKVIKTSVTYGALEEEEQEPEVVVAVVAEVIMKTLDLLFSVMLLYGVIKESVQHIRAWWWWSASLLVLTVAGAVWFIVVMAKEKHLVGVPIVVLAIIVCVTILFLFIVRKYVSYLKRKKMLPTIMLDVDDDEEDA